MSDPYALVSAALPISVGPEGAPRLTPAARLWNGEALTVAQQYHALCAAIRTWRHTGSHGAAALEAHEWLSEHVP